MNLNRDSRKSTLLVKNTVIIFIGKFTSQLLSLFLLPLYTAYLTPKDYGLVDLIVTYVTLLVPAITVQMEMAGFRFLIDARADEAKKKEVISNVLQIVLGVSTGLSILYILLANFIHIPYSNLILMNVIAAVFANVFLQFARGLGDNKRFAIASALTGVATLIATVLFVVKAHTGAGGVLGALIVANLACALYLFFSLRLYRYIDLRTGSRKLKKRLLHYSLPLVPNGISWWVIDVSDRTIISIFLGLAANGIYAVSNKYAAIFSSLFSIFSLALMEAASIHVGDKDSDNFLSQSNSASIKLFGALGLILIAGAPIVFKLFIGPDFQQANQYVPILVVAALFNAIVGIYSAIYVAKKMTKQVAVTSIGAAVINIVLTLIFVMFLGIYAAALATVAAYASMTIFRHYDLKKYVNITYEKNLFLKVGLAYSLVIALYYTHNTVAIVANIILAIVISTLLNRSTLSSTKNMVFAMLRARRRKA